MGPDLIRVAPVLSALILLAFSGCTGGPLDPAPGASEDGDDVTGNGNVTLEVVWEGFEQPLLVTHAGDARAFIVEQVGRIHVAIGEDEPTEYADLSGRIQDGVERGLLGLAFHPDDPEAVFVSYTDTEGDSVLSRFREQNGSLDADSEEILLQVDQPFGNHNGGHIAFGPDGHLYLGLGDGGSGGDPLQNGQNPATLLGSVLRLEVGPEGAYGIPDDNPFVGDPTGADEVWVYGLRNPWRFSFDAENGDLWIGDVGQNMYEEIDHQPAGSGGGANYGWNHWEGDHAYPSGTDMGPREGYTFPVAEYAHTDGDHCSVTGGVVAADDAVAALDRLYLFGDYCSGVIWSMAGPDAEPEVLLDTDLRISSFGVDGPGHVYVTDHAGGSIYRFSQD